MAKMKKNEKKYEILHAHGYGAPGGKRSYIKFNKTFSTKNEAKKWADKNLTKERFRYVPSKKIRKTKFKSLYYITK